MTQSNPDTDEHLNHQSSEVFDGHDGSDACSSPLAMSVPSMSPLRMSSFEAKGATAVASDLSMLSTTHLIRPKSSDILSYDRFEFAPLSVYRAAARPQGFIAENDASQSAVEVVLPVSTKKVEEESSESGKQHNLSNGTQPSSRAPDNIQSFDTTTQTPKCHHNANHNQAITSDYGVTINNSADLHNKNVLMIVEPLQPSPHQLMHSEKEKIPPVAIKASQLDDATVQVQSLKDAVHCLDKTDNVPCAQVQSQIVVNPVLGQLQARQHESRQQQTIDRCFRVSKVSKARAQPKNSTDADLDIDDANRENPRLCEAPSEEDLILLYMRRQRLKNDEERRQNKILTTKLTEQKAEHAACLRDRDRVTRQHERATVENLELMEQVSSFRARYSKIKQWALEFNHDYASLQQQSIELKDQIAELKIDQRELRHISAGSKALVEKTSSDQQKFQTEIADIRTSFSALVFKYDGLKVQHKLACTELRNERSLRKKLEVHVSEIWSAQSDYANHTKAIQEKIFGALTEITRRFDDQEDTFSDVVTIEQISALQQILTCQTTSFSTSHQDLLAKFSSVSDGIINMLKPVATKDDLCSAFERMSGYEGSMTSIRQMIEGLRPDMDADAALKEAKYRLEEQIASSHKVEAMLQRDKNSAEDRICELENFQRKLVDEVVKPNQIDTVAISKFFVAAKERLGSAAGTSTTNAAILQQIEERLKTAWEENGRLNAELQHTRTSNFEEMLRLQNSHQQQLLFIEQELESCDIVGGLHLEDQADVYERVIAKLREELSTEEACHAVSIQHVEEYHRHNKQLHATVEGTQTIVKDLQAQLTDKSSEIEGLNQMLTAAGNVAAECDNLRQQLSYCTTERDDLKSHVVDLAECKAKLSASLSENSELKHQIVQLEKDIQALKHPTNTVKDLEMEAADLRSELKIVGEELLLAQRETESVQELKEQSESLKEQIKMLEGGLSVAENKAKNVPVLEQKVLELNTQLIDLRKQLSEATNRAEQMVPLSKLAEERETALKTQTQEIYGLREQLEHAHSETEVKISEIYQLRDKIYMLQAEQGQMNQRAVQTSSRSSKRALMQLSQGSIQLSSPSVVPDSQSDAREPLATIQSQEIHSIVEGADTVGIDPLLIFKASGSTTASQHDLHNLRAHETPETQEDSMPMTEIPETLQIHYPSSSSLSELTDPIDDRDIPFLKPVVSAVESRLSVSTRQRGQAAFKRMVTTRMNDGTSKVPLSPSRPCSATSQEDMLLQETPKSLLRNRDQVDHISRSSVPTNPRNSHYGTVHEVELASSPAKRGGSSSHQDIADGACGSNERETPRPNSAVKRRHDVLPTGSKRLKRNPGNLSLQIPTSSIDLGSYETRTSSSMKSGNSMHVGIRSGTSIKSSGMSTNPTQRKSTRNGRLSKAERYSKRFGSTANC